MSLNNLRSLTLNYGTYEEFDSICPLHLPMLEILRIKGKVSRKSLINDGSNEMSMPFFGESI
jgi:hypothetical protein